MEGKMIVGQIISFTLLVVYAVGKDSHLVTFMASFKANICVCLKK